MDFEILNLQTLEKLEMLNPVKRHHRILHKLDYNKDTRSWEKTPVHVYPNEIKGMPRSVLGKAEFEWQPLNHVYTILVDEAAEDIHEWRSEFLK